jgi:hypothetical protein
MGMSLFMFRPSDLECELKLLAVGPRIAPSLVSPVCPCLLLGPLVSWRRGNVLLLGKELSCAATCHYRHFRAPPLIN